MRPKAWSNPRIRVLDCSTLGKGEGSTLIIVGKDATAPAMILARRKSDSDVNYSRGRGNSDVDSSKKKGPTTTPWWVRSRSG